MLAQTYPKRLQILPDRDYSNPHDHYHRLRIWHDSDGRKVILMDWDYQSQTLEHKQRCMNDVSVNISLFGKITALGNDIHNEVRRRIRQKTNVPHLPSQAIVPLPPGPRPVSRNVDIPDHDAPPRNADVSGSNAPDNFQALQRVRDTTDDKIQILGRTMSRVRPALDLREFPKKLIHAANDQERRDLLQLLHERFWHAAPLDMIKLLTGMLLPKDIVLQGADVAKACETCKKRHRRMHKPQVKAHYAIQFNEIVQHDLIFLFDETFMLLIDECIRY